MIVMVGMLLYCSSAATAANDKAVLAEMRALQQRVAELERQQSNEAVQARNAELMREMLQELALRKPALVSDTGLSAGYDKGFFIKSLDDQFLLKIKTQFQFRHTYINADDGDGTNTNGNSDPSGNTFEIEQARIKFTGHVLKDLKYCILLDLDDDTTNFGRLKDYYVKYSFMPEIGVQVGRQLGAFGRQENISSGRQMFVGRSLANEVFNIGRTTGLELFGDIAMLDTSLNYRVGLYNGFRDATNAPFAQNDNTPAVAARAQLPLLGASVSDFLSESDLAYHENPVALVGCSFGYTNARQEDSFAIQDGNQYTALVHSNDGLTDRALVGGECTMFGADVAFKCNGFSAMLEGFYQHAELDSAEAGLGVRGAGIDGLGVDNYGWNAQAGYFLVPHVFEVISRVGGICVDNSNDSYEYAGGWNWYLGGNGHDLKLTMDVTYIDDLPTTSSSSNYYGIINQSSLMLRSQLQVAF